MKKRYLKTVEDVLAFKGTDTKIYAERIHGYYRFVNGVWCSFDDDCPDSWSLCPLTCKGEELYVLEEEPEQEATEDDVNKLCTFWDDDENDFSISILRSIDIGSQTDRAFVDDFDGVWIHCRRLTPSEVAELTGYKVSFADQSDAKVEEAE